MEINSILQSIVGVIGTVISFINGIFNSIGGTYSELIKLGIALLLGYLISRKTSQTFVWIITALLIYLALSLGG